MKNVIRHVEDMRAGPLPRDDHSEGVISLAFDRSPPTIKPKGLVMLVAGFLAFKGTVIAHLGTDAYMSAISVLENGAWAERAGAFIMRPDVLSQMIASQLTAILA